MASALRQREQLHPWQDGARFSGSLFCPSSSRWSTTSAPTAVPSPGDQSTSARHQWHGCGPGPILAYSTTRCSCNEGPVLSGCSGARTERYRGDRPGRCAQSQRRAHDCEQNRPRPDATLAARVRNETPHCWQLLSTGTTVLASVARRPHDTEQNRPMPLATCDGLAENSAPQNSHERATTRESYPSYSEGSHRGFGLI